MLRRKWYLDRDKESVDLSPHTEEEVKVVGLVSSLIVHLLLGPMGTSLTLTFLLYSGIKLAYKSIFD